MRLVPFQINPHYTEEVLANHGGETRMDRIAEFTRVNRDVVVIGLREGSALRVIHGVTTLLGPHPAKLFREDTEPVEHAPGQINLQREVIS
jgi:dipeptidase E